MPQETLYPNQSLNSITRQISINQWLTSLKQEFEKLPKKASIHKHFNTVRNGIFSSTLQFISTVLEQFLQEIQDEELLVLEEVDDEPLLSSYQHIGRNIDENKLLGFTENGVKDKQQKPNFRKSENFYFYNNPSNKQNFDQSQIASSKQQKKMYQQNEDKEDLKKYDNQWNSYKISSDVANLTLNNVRLQCFDQIQKDQRQRAFSQKLMKKESNIAKLKKQQEEKQQNVMNRYKIIIENNSQQTQMEQLFNQIIILKGRIQSEIKRFFKSQLDKMFFCHSSNEQIKSKIFSFSQEELNDAKQDYKRWKNDIENLLFDNQKHCKAHKENVYYICNSDYLPENIYLCNQCIFQISSLCNHISHQITCRRHREAIKYKFDSSSKQFDKELLRQESQMFACDSCIRNNNDQKYSLLCLHHFATAQIACMKLLCIRKDQFIICQFCLNKHEDHQKVQLNSKQLMQKFRLDNNITLESYAQILNNVNKRLQQNPIKKMIQALKVRLNPVYIFLDSFGVNKDDIHWWVDQLIKEGNKGIMSLLVQINNIKHMSQQKRLNFLEVFNNKLQVEQQRIFENVWKSLEQMAENIEKFLNIKQQQIEKHLNKKYRRVEIRDNAEAIPVKLCDISPSHYHRVLQIDIDKECEEIQEDLLNKREKEERQTFFTSAWNKIKHRIINSNKEKTAFDLLLQQGYTSEDLLKTTNLEKHQNLLKTLAQQQAQITSRYDIQQKRCIQLQQILQNKFANLQIIRIEYQRTIDDHSLRNRYSVCAFKIFNTVKGLKYLKELQIIGIQIQNIELFAKCNRVAKKKVSSNKLNKQNKEIIGNSLEWLPNFEPSLVTLRISGTYKFNLDSKKATRVSEDLEQFIKLFSSVSCLTVKISTPGGKWDEDLQERLDLIIQSIFPISGLSLILKSTQDPNDDQSSCVPFLKQILKQFKQFTTISQIVFQDINLSRASEKDNNKLQKYLGKIFSNNKITHLRIQSCMNFPALPECSSLCHVISRLTSFSKSVLSMQTFLSSNNFLKTVQIDYNQDLVNLIEQQGDAGGFSFKKTTIQTLRFDWSPWAQKLLDKIQCSSIKLLTIHHQNNRKAGPYLDAVFSNLSNITRLQMSYTNITSKNLLLIPSQELSILKIWDNPQITNEDIWSVDCRWPYLAKLTLCRCKRLNEILFKKCKFIGLIDIFLDSDLLQNNQSIMKYLKKRKGLRAENF